jgi:AcrR family transcriptional regulator
VDDGGLSLPPSNQQRRNQLTDAGIEIVARCGLHGLSHRAVDEQANVPRGTTSNYFRSREELVAAMVQRIVDLHFALMSELRQQHSGSISDFLGGVVDHALTRFPGRYLAFFELALESARKPKLRVEFDRIADEAMKLTQEAHGGGNGEEFEREIELLNAFYNGVLFTSLVMPQALRKQSPGELTRAMLYKVLDSDQAKDAAKRQRHK